MTEEKEQKVEPVRVAMQWPPDLKEAVREEVGPRGLTDFTIAAVRARLGTHDDHKADSKKLNEVRFLAQRLADAIAMGSDYEDPLETLQMMELPSWIRTDGWTPELAAIVHAEDPTPEPVKAEPAEPVAPRCPYHREQQQCEELAGHEGPHHTGDLMWGDVPEVSQELRAQHRPVEDVELPAVGDPGTIRSEAPPVAPPTNDLAERVRAKALEKGVDLSGVDLQPASNIEAAEPPTEQPEEHNHVWRSMPDPHGIYTGKAYVCDCGETMDDSGVYAFGEVPPPKAAPPAAANADTCPNCGSLLVGDECWECM